MPISPIPIVQLTVDPARLDIAQVDLVQANLTQADLAQADLTQTNIASTNSTRPDITRTDTAQTDSTQPDLAQTAAQIKRACQEVGFFYLSGHRLSSAQIQQTFNAAAAFFDLPLAVKLQLLRSPQTNCGYVPLAAEQLNPDRPHDLKEAFNLGRANLSQAAIELPQLPEFQVVMQSFYQAAITQVIQPLLTGLAIALDLPPQFFVERHHDNIFLRLLHYPPIPATEPDQLRAGEHTDYGTLTLLFQTSNGLEIQTKDAWIPVAAEPDLILVNLGDALQRWTNDRFRSTPHRVNLGANLNQSRYSIAVFCDPDPEVEIACLPSCLSNQRYAPIRYQDYLQSRLNATYLPAVDQPSIG